MSSVEPDRTTGSIFDSHLDSWRQWQEAPWGRLRYRIVQNLLARHLAGTSGPQTIVDLGGGDGADSVGLAERHHVVVADSSAGMLRLAEQRAAHDGVPVRTVLTQVAAPEGLPQADLLLLHNVLQYCQDPQDGLDAAVRSVRSGGLISVLVSNPVVHVLGAAVRDLDPAAALELLDARDVRTRTFDHDVRRITWQDATTYLNRSGADVVARYGVLCVNHLITDDARKEEPAFFEALERLELALVERDPYRDVAAMWMLVARRR